MGALSSGHPAHLLKRKLILVSGKGGVGKTVVSRAVARLLSEHGGFKTLWVTIEDPLRPPGELTRLSGTGWSLNCETLHSFEDFVATKIGVAALAHLFVKNGLIRYLVKAAPGVAELMIIGKIWNECAKYDRVVVDMPSTGYGIALFQSTRNFSRLFTSGPLQRDANAMLEFFGSTAETGQLIVALPEEMPLVESLEMGKRLVEIFPGNEPFFAVNRIFPRPLKTGTLSDSPVPESIEDYVRRRATLEEENVALWSRQAIPFQRLEFVRPPMADGLNQTELERRTTAEVVDGLTEQMKAGGWLGG